MKTLLEEQDERRINEGFHPDKDFEFSKINAFDYKILQNLRYCASIAETKDKAIKELANAQSGFDILKIYFLNGKSILEFIKEQKTSGPSKITLPEKSLLEKVDKFMHYINHRDSLIKIFDAEIREDKAYEANGMTVKEGWIRLYYK